MKTKWLYKRMEKLESELFVNNKEGYDRIKNKLYDFYRIACREGFDDAVVVMMGVTLLLAMQMELYDKSVCTFCEALRENEVRVNNEVKSYCEKHINKYDYTN
jgi:hypothetical protein